MPSTNQQLLTRIQSPEDRWATAEAMQELVERAEKSSMLQEMLRKVNLRPPFDIFEYIKPKNRKGYWARKPYWREFPTIPQMQAKLALSEIATSLYGERGVVERPDGTRIPRESHLVGEAMRGMKFMNEEDMEKRKRQRIIDRIAQAIRA